MSSTKQAKQPKPSPLAALPVALAARISTYMAPRPVFEPEELSNLLDAYPLEYLTVELVDSGGPLPEHLSGFEDVLGGAPAKLQEVVLGNCEYRDWANVIGRVLEMKLECFSLSCIAVFPMSIMHLAEKCCASANGKHFLDIAFYPAGMILVDAATAVNMLIREDKALVRLGLIGLHSPKLHAERLLTGWPDPSALAMAHLKLTGLEMHPEDVVDLANALENNCNLLTLEIDSYNMRDRQLELLGKAIAKNNVLVSLFVCCDQDVSCEGVETFIKSISANKTLESLALTDGTIDERVSIAFAGLLKDNETLRLLDIGACTVAVPAWSHLIKAIKENISLETLRVVHCDISPENLSSLVKLKRKWWSVKVKAELDQRSQDESESIKGVTLPRRMLWQSGWKQATFYSHVHQWYLNRDKVRDCRGHRAGFMHRMGKAKS